VNADVEGCGTVVEGEEDGPKGRVWRVTSTQNFGLRMGGGFVESSSKRSQRKIGNLTTLAAVVVDQRVSNKEQRAEK
jgi:hypothetical protein